MASIWKRKGAKRYSVTYVDEHGVRRTVPGLAGKTDSDRYAASLEAESDRRRRGLSDPLEQQRAEASRKSLIVRDAAGEIVGGHLRDFADALIAADVTAKHAGTKLSQAARIIDLSGAERIAELTPSRVQAALKVLQDGVDGQAGLSAQTRLHYLRSIKQFSGWLERDKRVKDDALAHLSGPTVATDRRHRRRCLSDDELQRLVTAAENGPAFLRMSGPDRAMVYAAAAATGFRANELRSLTPESFDLDGDPASVTVEAGASKHRREDVQLIPDEFVAMIRPWLAGKPEGQSIFPLPDRTAKMLRADLSAARETWLNEARTPAEREKREASTILAYRDHAGLVFDFHALRGQFITAIVRGGASLKVAMDMARHSDPRLTLGTYTHLATADKRGALSSIPVVRPRRPDTEQAKATGTCGGPDRRAAHAQRASATSCNIVQHQGVESHLPEGGRNSLKMHGKAGITGAEATQAPVAQLDSASVFGTEVDNLQVVESPALTAVDDSARSARRSADSENAPDDCPNREPGTWCPVRVAAGLVAAGLERYDDERRHQ